MLYFHVHFHQIHYHLSPTTDKNPECVMMLRQHSRTSFPAAPLHHLLAATRMPSMHYTPAALAANNHRASLEAYKSWLLPPVGHALLLCTIRDSDPCRSASPPSKLVCMVARQDSKAWAALTHQVTGSTIHTPTTRRN
ncbi:uncharacterized protein LOC123498712 [Portunus trituberculatus]|uniref:uncharacterized protein LOC123498712 n=1 Tax=Portunus trituberculatus TaxID=210409 RepID=UPI001E1CE47D|nr:uncharacterized protein LOC123498712 [Portunus trituberculatus]